MQDEPLRPATTDELVEVLPFALQYDGRRRVRHAGWRVAAERRAAHLEQSGFVMMKKPPLRPGGLAGVTRRSPRRVY